MTFHVGEVVRVNDSVLPVKFAGRQGVVTEVRRVVPLRVVRRLALEGKLPNNGDVEIGVDLAGAGARGQLETDAWFLPHELTAVTALSYRPRRSDRSGGSKTSGESTSTPDAPTSLLEAP